MSGEDDKVGTLTGLEGLVAGPLGSPLDSLFSPCSGSPSTPFDSSLSLSLGSSTGLSEVPAAGTALSCGDVGVCSCGDGEDELLLSLTGEVWSFRGTRQRRDLAEDRVLVKSGVGVGVGLKGTRVALLHPSLEGSE